ncbi:MAG: hypothetical protein RIB59_16030, partial [Rhodospirillales bacterium]
MNSTLDTALPHKIAAWPYAVLAAGAIIGGALAFYLQPNDLWPARLLLLVLWIGCVWLLVRRRLAVLLLSPVAILGGLSIFAYSFLPALIPIQSKYIYAMRNWIHDLPPYLNSLAEALIVGFSALMILTLVGMATYIDRTKITINFKIEFHPYVRFALLIGLILSLMLQGVWS